MKINNCRRRVGASKAFEPKFVGPYKIVKVLGDLNYLLESPNLPQEIVHYNRLSRFYDRDPQYLFDIDSIIPLLESARDEISELYK